MPNVAGQIGFCPFCGFLAKNEPLGREISAFLGHFQGHRRFCPMIWDSDPAVTWRCRGVRKVMAGQEPRFGTVGFQAFSDRS